MTKSTLLLIALGIIALITTTLPAAAQTGTPQGPAVTAPADAESSPALRDIPAAEPHTGALQGIPPLREIPRQRPQLPAGAGQPAGPAPDPLLQQEPPHFLELPFERAPAPAPAVSFQGLSDTDNIALYGSLLVPPDPNGDVGPSHYVQMVNVALAVYDKAGTRLKGPVKVSSLWAGSATQTLCRDNDDGDPIVLHDQAADRWLISQFAVPGLTSALCVAVSKTPDPLGEYWLYQFQTAGFPDYPKYGVWPDATYNAYYVSTNDSGATVYALDRARMLNGLSASTISFSRNTNFLLPADLDGNTGPPTGTPGLFYTFLDTDTWGAAQPSIALWTFRPDFTTPAGSTFTNEATIPIAAFTYTVCGFFELMCIDQPAPGSRVDAVSEWPMWRLAYRNFGSHESLVGNFAVNVSGTAVPQSGIRWFELRRPPGGNWALHQEGTHAPDGNHRWMGSIAMDGAGGMVLGYSVSGTALNPGLRYAARIGADPLGSLGPEGSLIEGGGVQTGTNRWGDYAAMSVDPADDCTFWFTGMYYAATSQFGWTTRIGAFRLPGCQATGGSLTGPDLLLLLD